MYFTKTTTRKSLALQLFPQVLIEFDKFKKAANKVQSILQYSSKHNVVLAISIISCKAVHNNSVNNSLNGGV